ncbi:unnamed protein product, partial [Didymodactylos carnosus]
LHPHFSPPAQHHQSVQLFPPAQKHLHPHFSPPAQHHRPQPNPAQHQTYQPSPDLATFCSHGPYGRTHWMTLYGIFVDCFGAIYVTDHAYHRIQLWANSSVGVTIIGSQNGTSGTGPNDLDGPIDVKLDQQSNIYVLDTNNNRIQKYPPGGGTGSTIGTLPSNSGANALFVDGCGNFYISQTSGVYQFTQVSGSGTLIPLTFTGSPSGIAFDAQMNLYINVNNVTAGTTYKYAYI